MDMKSPNIHFVAYQQAINIFLCDQKTFDHDILAFKHVLKFIYQNREKLNRQIPLVDVLPIIHHSLRLELQPESSSTENVGAYICALLEAADGNDVMINCSLQILFQVLTTLSLEDVQRLPIGDEVFLKLIVILKCHHQVTDINANILACIQLYVRKFQSTRILQILWSPIKATLSNSPIIDDGGTNIQILVHLYDEFAEHIPDFQKSPQITSLIQHLLSSSDHDSRKCAYYLLKKFHLTQATKEKQLFWTICINIFENLEENQSHLILPSLEKLKNIETSYYPTQSSWLNILYQHTLAHNNILVRRWIIEHLLESTNYEMIFPATRRILLEALNDTTLYNVEGYYLPQSQIENFLTCDHSDFFEIFSEIKWKAVPLHYWLIQLYRIWDEINAADVSQKVLKNLATKVRTIQNLALRRKNIAAFNRLFRMIIEKMDLNEYAQYLEALYNVSDPFYDLNNFNQKFERCNLDNIDGSLIFTQRLCDIVTNQLEIIEPKTRRKFDEILLTKLQGQPIYSHGFLRYYIVFDLEVFEEKQAFCRKFYDLNLEVLSEESDFQTLFHIFHHQLKCGDDGKHFLKRKVTDFYVNSKLKEYSDLTHCQFKLDELLSSGTEKTLLKITNMLAQHKEKVEDSDLNSMIDNLREYLKKDDICQRVCFNLLAYCQNAMYIEDVPYWMKVLLHVDLENLTICSVVLSTIEGKIDDNELLINGALIGDAKTGDSRIEESYEWKKFQALPKFHLIRSQYLSHMRTIKDGKDIFNKVCQRIKELQLKKPRYYGNSTEHRLTIRMTRILLELLPPNFKNLNIFSHIWDLLLYQPCNQPNVTHMYEHLLIRCIDFQTLFEKVEDQLQKKKCTSSQEVSLIVVLYHFCMNKFDCASLSEIERVVLLLWPLTMGSNFQTRLYAQLVIVFVMEQVQNHINLCPHHHSSLSNMQSFSNLAKAIKQTIGDEQLDKFSNDSRLQRFHENHFDEIMRITNGVYDEFNSVLFQSSPTKGKLTDCAKKTANESVPLQDSSDQNINTNFDVQRKINPTNDFLPMPNLISYPKSKENEIYVVASLIDKLPNLGGIARTCEVLGCKILVVDSKNHLEKNDFKNLSMTAEKTLNILEVRPLALQEFLMVKKGQGFKIVGAEQTANSSSFIDFTFPKQCVLLLGHEKEGIPSNLLGFLDYAVEIPQFGMVRSLNVHVTGALFMWEYCKQHIADKGSTIET